MAVQDILAGVSGALSGGLQGYSAEKDSQERKAERDEQNRIRNDEVDRKKALDANNETERQRQIAAQQAIIASWPDTKADGSPNELKLAMQVQYASPKGNLGSTIVSQAGQTQRHNTASGDTIAREAGQNDRADKNSAYLYDKLFTEEDGRNNRWATPSGNATLGAATTRRGQDVSASTTRRGQDIGASTATRGQDLTFQLGTTRDKTTRDLGTARNAILKNKGSILDAFKVPGEPTGVEAQDVNLPVDGAPVAAPSAPVKGTIPVTPRAGGGGAALPVPQDVSDADIDTLAKSILAGQGIAQTPENIKLFKDRNRDKLIAKIKAVRGGGGGDL